MEVLLLNLSNKELKQVERVKLFLIRKLEGNDSIKEPNYLNKAIDLDKYLNKDDIKLLEKKIYIYK